jgi:hypothetical protein
LLGNFRVALKGARAVDGVNRGQDTRLGNTREAPYDSESC